MTLTGWPVAIRADDSTEDRMDERDVHSQLLEVKGRGSGSIDECDRHAETVGPHLDRIHVEL
jgi:hypothetical protein